MQHATHACARTLHVDKRILLKLPQFAPALVQNTMRLLSPAACAAALLLLACAAAYDNGLAALPPMGWYHPTQSPANI